MLPWFSSDASCAARSASACLPSSSRAADGQPHRLVGRLDRLGVPAEFVEDPRFRRLGRRFERRVPCGLRKGVEGPFQIAARLEDVAPHPLRARPLQLHGAVGLGQRVRVASVVEPHGDPALLAFAFAGLFAAVLIYLEVAILVWVLHRWEKALRIPGYGRK